MDNFGYMLAAFIIIWLVLFTYIFILYQRQSRLRRDIERLKSSLSEKVK